MLKPNPIQPNHDPKLAKSSKDKDKKPQRLRTGVRAGTVRSGGHTNNFNHNQTVVKVARRAR
jgi:hypothetical protein